MIFRRCLVKYGSQFDIMRHGKIRDSEKSDFRLHTLGKNPRAMGLTQPPIMTSSGTGREGSQEGRTGSIYLKSRKWYGGVRCVR